MTKMLKIFETNPYLANPDHDEMKKKKLDKEMKTLTRIPEEIKAKAKTMMEKKRWAKWAKECKFFEAKWEERRSFANKKRQEGDTTATIEKIMTRLRQSTQTIDKKATRPRPSTRPSRRPLKRFLVKNRDGSEREEEPIRIQSQRRIKRGKPKHPRPIPKPMAKKEPIPTKPQTIPETEARKMRQQQQMVMQQQLLIPFEWMGSERRQAIVKKYRTLFDVLLER